MRAPGFRRDVKRCVALSLRFSSHRLIDDGHWRRSGCCCWTMPFPIGRRNGPALVAELPDGQAFLTTAGELPPGRRRSSSSAWLTVSSSSEPSLVGSDHVRGHNTGPSARKRQVRVDSGHWHRRDRLLRQRGMEDALVLVAWQLLGGSRRSRSRPSSAPTVRSRRRARGLGRPPCLGDRASN